MNTVVPLDVVGRWLDILRPGYERIAHIEDRKEALRALERETVVVSLENLWDSYELYTLCLLHKLAKKTGRDHCRSGDGS